MRMRHRLKRACVNFIRELADNPPSYASPREVIRYIEKDPEPDVVLDNQLLAGKNALITGAGRNIGRSIALEMAKQGANIFFTEIDRERCINLEQELSAYPVQVKGFLSDVSKTEETDALCAALQEAETNIDILVNNAGIQFETVDLENQALAEWRQTFETNVFGPLYLTKTITQNMVKHHIHGTIIFITSIHQWTISGWPSYSASKAALGMVIKELAVELATHQIRVNGIAPGWVAENEDEQQAPFPQPHTPLHHSSIKPRYIGRAAVYLAADYFSKFTTSTVLTIDGGLSLFNYMAG